MLFIRTSLGHKQLVQRSILQNVAVELNYPKAKNLNGILQSSPYLTKLLHCANWVLSFLIWLYVIGNTKN